MPQSVETFYDRLGKSGFVKVKNIHHTKGRKPPYPHENLTWAEFWEEYTGKDFDKCKCASCGEPAEVGGHVIKVGQVGKDWYIVPLCTSCNNPYNVNPFMVKDDLLVPIYED